jgi:ribosomal protein L13
MAKKKTDTVDLSKMSEWEVKKYHNKQQWDSLTEEQRNAVMSFMKPMVNIRHSVSELMPLDYDSLCKIDAAWYKIKGAFGLDIDSYEGWK